MSNEMLSRVLGSKFGMGYLKFLKKDRKKLLKDRSLKAMLLNILQTEGSYIDVDTIIVKMKKQFSCPLFSFYFSFKISHQYCPCI